MSAIITNNQLCTADCRRRDKVRERKASENKAAVTSPGPSTSCTARGALLRALWQPRRAGARGRPGLQGERVCVHAWLSSCASAWNYRRGNTVLGYTPTQNRKLLKNVTL